MFVFILGTHVYFCNTNGFKNHRHFVLMSNSFTGHIFVSVVSLQVKATDADADQFGEIEYSLYDGFNFYEKSKAFQIDPHTGQIFVSQDIDREGDPTTYDLLVKATDGVSCTFLHCQICECICKSGCLIYF